MQTVTSARLLIVALTLVVIMPAFAQPTPEAAVTFIRVGITDPITHARRELTQGSGFLIDLRGHIVTARHVIQYKNLEESGPRWISVSLRDRNAFPVPAQIVACESGNIDLCLIKVPEASVSAAGIITTFAPSCRHLESGERITALGYPFGSNNPVIRVPGDVTGELATELKYPSNVQIIPGMSGGPVLDLSGRVVAVNAAGAEAFPTLTFLQPLVYGEGLIKRAGLRCDIQPVLATTRVDPSLPDLRTPNISCASKKEKITVTQFAQNSSTPTERSYTERLLPDTGCKITSVDIRLISANNHSDPNVIIAQDGKVATVSYSLRSGPFFDRYRGWIDADVTVTQAPQP